MFGGHGQDFFYDNLAFAISLIHFAFVAALIVASVLEEPLRVRAYRGQRTGISDDFGGDARSPTCPLFVLKTRSHHPKLSSGPNDYGKRDDQREKSVAYICREGLKNART